MRTAHSLAAASSLVVAALVAGCGGGSLVLKSPLADKCIDAGLKRCDELTEGVLTYVEGDRAGGTARIQRVVVDNDAARVRKLAGLLRTAASAPGLGSFKAQLEEVATILDTSGGGGAGPAAPDPDAKPEAKADAKGEPRGGATDDARTKTVTAILAGHPRAYACAPLGKTSQAYAGSTCLRLGIGPLVVSDLVTSAACPGDILVMAGPSDAPAWVVGSVPPRERFAMHGARLVVGPEDELVVAVHSATALPRDATCGVTVSLRRP
ncbi:MAG: hypothetical protein IPF92_10635 [Myxococcales bacterium]|nr:hypothetical protein [Myxococcales bacterium]HQY62928.1 hypothetical protein [Polyangiaceae bacterium]